MTRKNKSQENFESVRNSLLEKYSSKSTGQSTAAQQKEQAFWDYLQNSGSANMSADDFMALVETKKRQLAAGTVQSAPDYRKKATQQKATQTGLRQRKAGDTLAPFASQRAWEDYYKKHTEGDKSPSLPRAGDTLPKAETKKQETDKKQGSSVVSTIVRALAGAGQPGYNGLTDASFRLATDTGYKEPTKEWTDKEREVYEALKIHAPDKADRFAIETNNSINKEKQIQERQQAQQFGKEHKALAWGANTASGVLGFGMGDYLAAGLEQAARGEVTEKPYATPRQLAEAASAGASAQINENHGVLPEKIPVIGGKGWGEVYQLTQSIAQSMALANATGSIGKVGAFATDAVFFGNAAASAFDDAKERGATDEQAYLFATANGLNEALGEHLSIENLITMKNPHTLAQLAKSILTQAGVEGSEEVFTSFLNNWADHFIMKDKSAFHQAVDEYIGNGMSEQDARKRAWLDMANDMAFDFVGGAFSGGVSGGMQSSANYITSNVQTRSAQQNREQGITQAVQDQNPAGLVGQESGEGTPLQEAQAATGSKAMAEGWRPFEISTKPGRATYQKSDGTTAEARITGVASSKKGELMLKVAGEKAPVPASSIQYANDTDAFVYSVVNSMDLKPAGAETVIKMAQERGDGAGRFMIGFSSVYDMGKNGIPLEEASKQQKRRARYLPSTERQVAYEMGQNAAVRSTATTEGNVPTATKQATQPAQAATADSISVLRQAVENSTSIGLSTKEKNALDTYSKRLNTYDTIQEKLSGLKAQEQTQKVKGEIAYLESKAAAVEKKLQEFGEYPLLKSTAAKMQAAMGNPKAGTPATVSEQAKVSKTVGTALEAQATTAEAAEKIQAKAAKGEFSYITITDAASKQRAEDTIKRKGWNDSLSDWRAGMGKTSFPGKDMVTMGFELYNNAVNAGDTKTAVSILTDLTGMVRNSAQVVQAVRILKQLSPENRLYAIRRQLDSLQEELNHRYGDKAPQIDMNSTLAENYRNAQGEENIQAAEDALFRDIASKLPNTFADKWNSWRYLSMLGNARTHVRNILGNAAFVPVRATKDLIAAGIEAGTNALSPEGIPRTKSVLVPTSSADRALYKAGIADYAAAEKLLGDVSAKRSDSISRIEEMRPAFGGDNAVWRALSKVSEINGNALSLEDVLFKKITYASAFGGYMKANGVTEEMIRTGKVAEEVMNQARSYAFEEALRATYNDFNDFSNFVSKLGTLSRSSNKFARAAGVLVEGTLPFKRTPANIVARAVEYSPIGMVNGIKQALVDVHKGKTSAAQAIDSIASGLTGTALLGLGALFANMGLISGGDDDDDKQNTFDQLRGKQSYALNAFGGSYTIDWLAPEVIPMFVGVELYNSVNESGNLKFKDVLGALADVSNPLLEMSCLSSLNDVLDSVSYSDDKLYSLVSQSAANYVLQALPTVFGQFERIGETEREQTYVNNDSQLPKDWQRTIAKAANKIPGVEYEQIPYIDIYGRRLSSGNVAERAFNNLMNPGYSSTDRSAPWDDELQRLYDLGYSGVLPTQAARKIGDKELSAEEYVEYATLVGQEKYRLLGQVTESDFYKGSSDADKEEIIKDLYTFVNAEGSRKMMPERSVAKWTEQAMEMEKLGISFTDFLHMRSASENENSNFSKAECKKYVQAHFPQSKQADILRVMEIKK